MKSKTEIFKMIHGSLSNGIRAAKSQAARQWLCDKSLSIDLTKACFSSGQLHHRKEESFIKELESVGFLVPSDAPTITGRQGYSTFLKEAIIFPLYNRQNEIVNLYGIRIYTPDEATGYINGQGIYPHYPLPETKKLYITKNILDAATLLESKIMDNKEAVIALHDGELKEQHIQLIRELSQLEEIIFIN